MTEGCNCNCGCQKTCCRNQSCCDNQQNNHECKEKHDVFLHYFLEIADDAWEEVLKEKIKEHILETQNKKMEELAKIVSEGNGERWKNKMEKRRGCCSFKEKLSQFFGGGSCKS